MALMELVDLYDCKLFADQVDEHIQAAFHYLTLAQQVQSQQHILFDTLELQNNGTLTGLDKLPTFVTEAILETTTLPRKENSSPLPTSRATNKAYHQHKLSVLDPCSMHLELSTTLLIFFVRK